MRIGIIGPTKIDAFCRFISIERETFERAVRKVATYLALTEHSVVLVPDKNSTAELFAKVYQQNDGKNVVGVIPQEDKEFGNEWLNSLVCNKVINCKTWRNQPMEFVKNCDVIICFGLGLGSMIEIAYSKWYPVNKIYLIKGLVSRLPLEITYKIHASYVDIETLLRSIRG